MQPNYSFLSFIINFEVIIEFKFKQYAHLIISLVYFIYFLIDNIFISFFKKLKDKIYSNLFTIILVLMLISKKIFFRYFISFLV